MPSSVSTRSVPKKDAPKSRPSRRKLSKRSSKKSKANVEIAFSFDELLASLKQALAHAQGKITLKTTVLPAPAPSKKPKRSFRKVG